MNNKYEVVIGIEVHCQLATKSKIFSRSRNSYGDAPNLNINPTCVGLPGALPVLNEECVNLALRMGLALKSEIQKISAFARKNYFYPDLPKAYQITQYDKPICLGGFLEIDSGKKIGIERIQLEEDAGKNIHVGSASFVDYNRSGVGLIEIVSCPDMSSPQEAVLYLKKLHSLVVNLNISDGDMERGNFRADANVSVRLKGSTKFGTRCEIKNVNSFKYIEKAIQYEFERQVSVLESGGTISLETRGYDSDKNITVSQRSKENAQDYRYFPEPDLPILVISDERIAKVHASLPELPEERSKRYQQDFKIPEYDSKVISSSKTNSDYFEQLVNTLKEKVDPKTIANFFMTDILRVIKLQEDTEKQNTIPVSIEHCASLLELQANGSISGRIAKDVFEIMLLEHKSPETIVKEKGFSQISDDSAIEKFCLQVLDENQDKLQEYLNGKEKLFGFFVGQAMKLSQGQLNPAKANQILKKLIAERQKL